MLGMLSVTRQPTVCDATTGFLAKWRLRNELRNSMLMTCHYPDLGSASDCSSHGGNLFQPIRSTTQIWVMTCHPYGISALVSQMSFHGETSGGISKCWLFSHVRNNEDCIFLTSWFIYVLGGRGRVGWGGGWVGGVFPPKTVLKEYSPNLKISVTFYTLLSCLLQSHWISWSCWTISTLYFGNYKEYCRITEVYFVFFL